LNSQLGYSQFCIVSLVIASFVVSLVIASFVVSLAIASFVKTGYYQADYTKLAVAKLTMQSWL
jgi:hypothetical protein